MGVEGAGADLTTEETPLIEVGTEVIAPVLKGFEHGAAGAGAGVGAGVGVIAGAGAGLEAVALGVAVAAAAAAALSLEEKGAVSQNLIRGMSQLLKLQFLLNRVCLLCLQANKTTLTLELSRLIS